MGEDDITYVPPDDMDLEELWHFWLGEDPVHEYQDSPTLLLCWKMTGSLQGENGELVNVTMNEGKVTCQDCREWMHA